MRLKWLLFFEFNLSISDDQSNIWLNLTGSDGTKDLSALNPVCKYQKIKVKKSVFGLLFSMATQFLFCQDVRLITLDQLYKRVNDSKDTVFVVNFWATWCVPCLEELPHFEKLSKQLKNKKLKVLLISMDSKSKLKSTVTEFVRRSRIKNEVFLLDENDQQIYINRIDTTWSGALPATLMLRNNDRRFFEKEFTYPVLLETCKNFMDR